MARVLLATLGLAPAVVSSALAALRERDEHIDRVDLVYPSGEDPADGMRWVEHGKDLLADFLRGIVDVQCFPVPVADTNTRDNALQFLQVVTDALELSASQGDDVRLLFSGGRKNMSALAVVAAGFFENVSAVSHVLNRRGEVAELSVEALDRAYNAANSKEQQRLLFEPLMEDINLFDVPFPRIGNGTALRKWLKHADSPQPPEPIQMSDEAHAFFSRMFSVREQLSIWLTETAAKQFRGIAHSDHNRLDTLRGLLAKMSAPGLLQSGKHGTKDIYHFFKAGDPVNRPCFYTTPGSIDRWPANEVDRCVVIGFSIHKGTQRNPNAYDFELDHWVKLGDFEPRYLMDEVLRNLSPSPMTLIAPLGLAPMVVSQTIALLATRENRKVDRVVIVYPELGEVADRVDPLEKACELKEIRIIRHPLAGVSDIDSTDRCGRFLTAMGKAIADERHRAPDAPLALLLSGGRKPMAACTFAAAQRFNVPRIYHTTIKDPWREDAIVQQINELLSRRRKPEDYAAVLFPQGPALDDFDLFEVPALPLL